MRIDAHVHFLVYNPREHVWVTDELNALKGTFLPGDLEPLLSSSGFDGCVAIEARQLPHETSGFSTCRVRTQASKESWAG